jgi:hypothetical protein
VAELERAERTTPAADGMVQIDSTRTFNVHGAYTESMVGLRTGGGPTPVVRADLTGKWYRGGEDKPVLLMCPDTAREWGQALIEAAAAAEHDVAIYVSAQRRRGGS